MRQRLCSENPHTRLVELYALFQRERARERELTFIRETGYACLIQIVCSTACGLSMAAQQAPVQFSFVRLAIIGDSTADVPATRLLFAQQYANAVTTAALSTGTSLAKLRLLSRGDAGFEHVAAKMALDLRLPITFHFPVAFVGRQFDPSTSRGRALNLAHRRFQRETGQRSLDAIRELVARDGTTVYVNPGLTDIVNVVAGCDVLHTCSLMPETAPRGIAALAVRTTGMLSVKLWHSSVHAEPAPIGSVTDIRWVTHAELSGPVPIRGPIRRGRARPSQQILS